MCTEKRLVRIFTLGGVQKEMFSLPGPVVCMSGHGSQLMVVYHSATGSFVHLFGKEMSKQFHSFMRVVCRIHTIPFFFARVAW